MKNPNAGSFGAMDSDFVTFVNHSVGSIDALASSKLI